MKKITQESEARMRMFDVRPRGQEDDEHRTSGTPLERVGEYASIRLDELKDELERTQIALANTEKALQQEQICKDLWQGAAQGYSRKILELHVKFAEQIHVLREQSDRIANFVQGRDVTRAEFEALAESCRRLRSDHDNLSYNVP